MLPHTLLDLTPEDLSINALCADFGIAEGLKRVQQINQAGGMVFPTIRVL